MIDNENPVQNGLCGCGCMKKTPKAKTGEYFKFFPGHQNRARVKNLRDKILEMYEAGESCAAIGRKVGSNKLTIKKIVSESGLKIRKHWEYGKGVSRVDHKTQEVACKEYLRTKCVSKASRKAGICAETARGIIRENGIEFCHPVYEKNEIDESFFFQIDTEEKAYWLGFIAADGCVLDNGTFTMSLSSKDRVHLEKFCRDVSFTGKIASKIKNGHPMSRVSKCSQKFCEGLGRQGVVPRKSAFYMPPKLDRELERHFWRGMVDGDGSVSYVAGSSSFTLCGSRQTVDAFQEYCETRLSLERVKVRSSVTKAGWEFCVVNRRGRNNLHTLLSDLYGHCNVFLDRKKKSADLIIASPRLKTAKVSVVVDGVEKNISEWAREIGCDISGLHKLIKKHGNAEQIIKRKLSNAK